MPRRQIYIPLQFANVNVHADVGPRRAPSQSIARAIAEVLEERRLMSFSPAVNYPATDYPVDVVAADLNNDGRLDLIASNAGTTRIGVLLGNGDGTFQAPLASEAGDFTHSVAVGDLNDDGTLDLAVATFASVNVMLGNGDGTFQAPSEISIGSDTASVAVGDFNADGTLDLGVRSHTYVPGEYDPYYYTYNGTYTGHLTVLTGHGDGSFAAPVTRDFSGGLFDCVVADLNRDGADDLVATQSEFGGIAVLFGDAAGQYQNTSTIGLNFLPAALAAGDINGDGNADLVMTRQYWYGSNVSVLPGDGAGGFGPAVNYPGANGNSIVLGDFDHDDQPDLAILHTNSQSSVTLLRARSDGTLGPAESLTVSLYASSLTTGDVNGDGWLDLITANPSGNNVSVLTNDRNWTPSPPSLAINDVTVTEGNSSTVTAVFTVTRSGSLAEAATVQYSTGNGGALAGSDYVAKSGTLTFAAGVATMQVTVAVNGDLVDEYDQHFFVNLSSPSGAVITDGQGTGVILDNDNAPTLTIAPKVSKKEGNKNSTSCSFQVTLSAPSEKSISVNFATADGTATTADRDYAATSGTLFIAPGTTSRTIQVWIIGDREKEADETFLVKLSAASNVTLLTSQAVGEILNDDKH